MKKIVSALVLVGLTATAANAAPSYITHDRANGYTVMYDYTDKAKTGWYVAGRAGASFLTWKNNYATDYVNANDAYSTDKFSMEPVFGASLAGGYNVGYFTRLELEAGYMGRFEDKDDVSEFTMEIPYLAAGLYYDFISGFYVGASLGVAMPHTTVDLFGWADGAKRSENAFAAMGGLMFGYTHKLDYNLVLDLRYRLAAVTGLEHEITFQDNTNSYYFKNDINVITDNSFNIGLRYEF